MSNFRCFLTLLLISLSTALYEDQVGKFDWKRSLIGKVKFAKFDNKRLYLATHDNILASLSLKKDQILWRQILEDPADEQLHLLHLTRDLVTVSGKRGNFHVRGWEPNTGSILWEWGTITERLIDPFWVINSDSLYHIVALPGSHVEVTEFALKTGETLAKTRRITAPFAGPNCAITKPYLTCINNGQLSWVDFTDPDPTPGTVSLTTLLGTPEEPQLSEFDAPQSILLVGTTGATVVELSNTAKPRLRLAAPSVPIGDRIYQLEANPNADKLITVRTLDAQGHPLDSTPIDYPRGLGGPYIVTGFKSGDAVYLLLSSTDEAQTLVKLPEGKVIWTREEALSNIVASEFFELPDVSLDYETQTGDILNSFLHRILTQSKQFYNWAFAGPLTSSNALIRDDFGLHKIIVLATRAGKLFGVDTITGAIVWSYRLPNVKAFNDGTMKLVVQRTARYAPLPAQCVLLAQDINTGEGVLIRFDPITGASSKGVERLNYRVKQVLSLSFENQDHIKPVLVVSEDFKTHTYPATALGAHDNTYIYSIEGGKLEGYKLGSNAGLETVWRMDFGPGKITAVSTRPPGERVHSQGRVLPDRSVYYKYVNPNLIALAVVNDDPIHKQTLTVYLIDGVTGLMVYSSSHKKIKGPVHLLHSENWLVYTFFNERFRRQEVVAAEMYEGGVQSNSTAFSSFGVSQLQPIIQTQSYILPVTPVSMAVTLTERGITSKFLLIGMSSGGVMEIPWLLLQPRFDDIACGPEENCIPYMPEIPILSEATLNYNQTLGRIKAISVAPARLESTCHVLITGLDLFYTRVAPSKTFDLLKEDFDHKLIVLVLSGLIVASYATKYLAAKKAQKEAWK